MALQAPTDTPFGLQPNIAAGLAYLFGLIGGIVILLGGGTNRMVKFAAAQSITMWGIYIVLSIVLRYIPLGALVMLAVYLIWFVLWLWTFISGFQGKEVEVPIIAGLTRSLFKSAAA